MGGILSGARIAQNCTYNTKDFRNRIDRIKDAHRIETFYSKLLLEKKMPLVLKEYPNYNASNEEYFNSRRNESIPGIESYGIKTYYEFYNMLGKLELVYANRSATEDERRTLIDKYVQIANFILENMAEELYNSCASYGIKDYKPEASPVASAVASAAKK